jgi:tRNA A37 threonylcarbamoyladenosine biosynthesis protein TsaE
MHHFFGPGDACWIQGKIDSYAYLDIVQDYVRQSRDWYHMDAATFGFQQENARVHTACKIMEFFEQKNIIVLSWPSNSPDLNPIEHVLGVYETKSGSLPRAAKKT